MAKYLALTIGPIFQTLRKARNTREIWGASYLFSTLMEALCVELQSKGAKVILPQKVNISKAMRFGAGIYNDRLFAEADALTSKEVKEVINSAINTLAAQLCPTGFTPDPQYWKQYLRIEWVLKPIDDITDGKLIQIFTPLLDTAELATPFFSNANGRDQLVDFFDKIYTTKIKDALTGSNLGSYKEMIQGKGIFPSTMDLATFELFQHNAIGYKKLLEEAKLESDDTNDADAKKIQTFFQKLEMKNNPFEDVFCDYHKYFCIVHADGDGIGNTIKMLGSTTDYSLFSQKLGSYAVEAAQIINDFGGKPVYIGGDDLLFFAPVCTRKDKKTRSIFSLIKSLDNAFKSIGLTNNPTLSFGITFSYHKFPLFEAYELSSKQLFQRSKKIVWADQSKKNAVAFRLLKHSGFWYEGLLNKTQLDELLNAEDAIRQTDGDLLSSMVYKINTLDTLLKDLDQLNLLSSQASWLFKNFFNEPVHQRNRNQLDLVQKLLLDIYRQKGTIDDDKLDQNANLYAVLRILKFITDKPQKSSSPKAEKLKIEIENPSSISPIL